MAGLFDLNREEQKSARSPRGIQSDSRMHFNSFSGTDIQCFIFDAEGPAKRIREANASDRISDAEFERLREKLIKDFTVKSFGELQTLSVSIANQAGPVRRLGEREVVEYKMGARTVAGSMIFAVLNRDVYANYMKGSLAGAEVLEWRSPNYVDEIPEFNILIQGANEFGAVASGMLIGVKLTNFGTTFSIDDLYTEATYSYVARHFIPFTDNWKKSIYDNLVAAASEKSLSNQHEMDSSKVVIGGEVYYINRSIYEWWQSLPPVARDSLKSKLPGIQDKVYSESYET